MTFETDIDLLLVRAAGPERANHVNPEFVARVEQRLETAGRWSLLRLLPGMAAVLASLIVVTGLLGTSVSFSELGSWLFEPLGLQLTLDALSGLGSRDLAGRELWPYALGAFAVLAPFWMPSTDL